MASPIKFQSLGDFTSDFIQEEFSLDDLLFPENEDIIENSVFTLRDETKKIFNDPNNIFELEFTPGMSLNSLATEYIGDSFAWEAIAILNDLDPSKDVEIGKVLKIPTQEQIKKAANKIIAPEANKIIDSVKGSILDITGLNTANTPFANNLKDCVNKVIDFKVNF